MVLPIGMTVYFAVVSFIFGAVMGSFLNCVAIRIVHGESFIRGRSHCMSCGHVLAAKDLVPIFSYLFLHGKCRYCGKKVSVRYPISELAAGIVFTTVFLRYGVTLRMFELLCLCALLLCISFCDLEDFTIPDSLVIITIAVRLVFLAVRFFIDREECLSLLLPSLIGAFSISLPLLIVVLIAEKVLKKEAMGGGDIKLLFALGCYFTWDVNLFGIVAACLVGIVFALIAKKSKGEAFPFGPSIAVGTWIAMLCGRDLIDAYLNLFAK